MNEPEYMEVKRELTRLLHQCFKSDDVKFVLVAVGPAIGDRRPLVILGDGAHSMEAVELMGSAAEWILKQHEAIRENPGTAH